jgi:2-hydroxychromene-2-carboxylate isomerase
MRAAFSSGADLSSVEMLRSLGPPGLEDAIADPEVKASLRAATDRAVALGVIGVPTTRVGDELYWGDDRLEEISI